MKPEELISALHALEERAAIAKREIHHTSAFDALQKRVWRLEQELIELKNEKQN
tara:strand:+ start:838 stop:999 length:162 start_codon:yes stop_codon:yes gene_type:complete